MKILNLLTDRLVKIITFPLPKLITERAMFLKMQNFFAV